MAIADSKSLYFEGFTLDLAARTLVDAGSRDVVLRRSEFELLLAFIAAPNRALSRDHLLDAVAGRRSEPFDRSIDVLVGRLRRKIEPEPSEPRLIVTVPGVGYRFAVKPQSVSAESDATPKSPASAHPASPERRQLTIMRCGLSGPALLSARRDPEDLQRLLVEFHTSFAAIIHRAGGAVAKRLGETILAYFGYPEAHEDEAERAIWAALRLVETTRAIATGDPGVLHVRVGIATGLMLVGDLLGAGSAEPAILGNAPDLAAGLLASAESGTVLIGPTTLALVGDTFRYRELAPIVLDGSADPTPAWQVIGEGVEGRFEALRGRAVAELVGREEELSFLLRRWEQAKAGAGRAVLVMGEPGIGKSRLIRAVNERLDDEAPFQLRYFCSPHHRDSALHPVIAQLEGVAGFGRDDTAEAKFAQLQALLARSEATDEAIALIAGLLSVPAGEHYRLPETSPQRLREKILAALLDLFARLVAREPALVIFEDVHWIDPTTLELLARTVERVASMRVLLLMTARPEFKPPWPDQAHGTTLLLNRLNDDELTMLARYVAAGVSLPGTVLRQIVRHAEGVPLFVEELTKAVLESGASVEGERSGSLPVPTSLHDLLLARLDRLGPAREVAQIGAVIGREFTYDLLSAVADQPETVLEQALARIVRSELLFRSSTADSTRYTFKHSLVQQAAYESLPRSRRSVLHAKIAETLLKRNLTFAGSQLDLLAWRCEQGGLTEKAAYFYTAAGFGSASRGAYDEAHEQFANASRMVAAMPDGEARDRRELDLVVYPMLATRWRHGYAWSEIGEVNPRAAELRGSRRRPADHLEVARARFMSLFFRGDVRHAQAFATDILRLSLKQDDPKFRIMGHVLIANTMMTRGDLLDAESHLRETLTLIQSCSADLHGLLQPLPDSEALSLRMSWVMAHLGLGAINCLLGNLERAENHLSALAEPALSLTPGHVEVSVLRLRIRLLFTDAAELASSIDRLRRLAREFGLALSDAMAMIVRGYALSCCGDPEQGIAVMKEGMDAYAAADAAIWSGQHRALFAEACQRLGRLDEARQLLTEAREWSERSGERWYDAELARRLGEVDCQQGDRGAAEAHFQDALAIARRQHAKLWELHAATSLARLWHEQRRNTEARALLAPVYGWFKEGFQTASLRRAKALLDELDQGPRTVQRVAD